MHVHCPALNFVLSFRAPSSQIPRFITVLPREGTKGLLPVEVVWWWLHRIGVRAGGWVMLCSAESHLAADLSVRGGVGLNVTWGIPYLEESAVDSLQEPMSELTGEVKVADGLPDVRWKQDVERVPSVHVP